MVPNIRSPMSAFQGAQDVRLNYSTINMAHSVSTISSPQKPICVLTVLSPSQIHMHVPSNAERSILVSTYNLWGEIISAES